MLGGIFKEDSKDSARFPGQSRWTTALSKLGRLSLFGLQGRQIGVLSHCNGLVLGQGGSKYPIKKGPPWTKKQIPLRILLITIPTKKQHLNNFHKKKKQLVSTSQLSTHSHHRPSPPALPPVWPPLRPLSLRQQLSGPSRLVDGCWSGGRVSGESAT